MITGTFFINSLKKNNTMKNNKLLLYPQQLTPAQDFSPTDDQEIKSLKINCLFYWKQHRFPDCCDFHRRRVLERNLNTDAWSNSGEHLFQAITYTLFFVDKAPKDEEGLARIKTYISSIFFSFGNQSPIVKKYVEWTSAILQNKKSLDTAFLKTILDYLATPDKTMEGTFQQLAKAEQAFNKWLGSLPEDLIPEEVRENLSRVFFQGIIKSLIEEDEYNAARSLELNSAAEFLAYLSATTKSVLHEIWESIARGDINETIQEASIIDRHKTTTEMNLAFENYTDEERNYLTIIHRWGEIVSDFIQREIERKQSASGHSKKVIELFSPEQKAIIQKQEIILQEQRATLLEQKAISASQKMISQPGPKVYQRRQPSFPELFKNHSYYDKFIHVLLKFKLIDQNLTWIDEDKNQMISIFWGLLNVKCEGRSIFIAGPPRPTPYAREIYKHFTISPRVLCPERYLTDHKKHVKVTRHIKNLFTKKLESAMFPKNN